MKKIIGIGVVILAALAFFCQATLAGESFEKAYSDDNVDAYKYHKTSFFGRDFAGVTIVGKQQHQPPILRLQHGSTTTSETTTTFSRCKERKEGRLTQAYFVGEEKKVIRTSGFQDAVNPANGQAPWSATVGGDGASTGNLLLPALALGGGNAASGWGAGQARNVISAFGGNADQQQYQKTKGTVVGINENTNVNPIKINTTATGTGIGTGGGVGVGH